MSHYLTQGKLAEYPVKVYALDPHQIVELLSGEKVWTSARYLEPWQPRVGERVICDNLGHDGPREYEVAGKNGDAFFDQEGPCLNGCMGGCRLSTLRPVPVEASGQDKCANCGCLRLGHHGSNGCEGLGGNCPCTGFVEEASGQVKGDDASDPTVGPSSNVPGVSAEPVEETSAQYEACPGPK